MSITKTLTKENVSSIFLLPCLKINNAARNTFRDFGYINSYMFCDKLHYNFSSVYLLFEPDIMDMKFYSFTLRLEANQNHIETIDIAPGKVLFVFRIPRMFEDDYKYILKGRYSRTSRSFRDCFPMRMYIMDENGKARKDGTDSYLTDYTIFYHVFNRTEIYRKRLEEAYGLTSPIAESTELYELYHEDRETLDYE